MELAPVLHQSLYQGVSGVSCVKSISDRVPVMDLYQGVSCVSSVSSIPDRMLVMKLASFLRPSSYHGVSGACRVCVSSILDGVSVKESSPVLSHHIKVSAVLVV